MTKFNLKFSNYFYIITLVQFLHSSEEIIFKLENWMTIVMEKINNLGIPFPVLSISEKLFIFLNILAVSVFGIISFLVFKNYRWAFKVAKIASIIEIINGILHITMAIIFLSYIPGCITGIGLVIFGVLCFKSYKQTQ